MPLPRRESRPPLFVRGSHSHRPVPPHDDHNERVYTSMQDDGSQTGRRTPDAQSFRGVPHNSGESFRMPHAVDDTDSEVSSSVLSSEESFHMHHDVDTDDASSSVLSSGGSFSLHHDVYSDSDDASSSSSVLPLEESFRMHDDASTSGDEQEYDALGPGDSQLARVNHELSRRDKSLPPTPIEREPPPISRFREVFDEDDAEQSLRRVHVGDSLEIRGAGVDEPNKGRSLLPRDPCVGPQPSSRKALIVQPHDSVACDSKSKKCQKRVQINEADKVVSRWSKQFYVQSTAPASKTHEASSSKRYPPAPEPRQQQPPLPLLSKEILDRISSNSSIVTDIKIEPRISIATCFSILLRAPAVRAFSVALGPSASEDERGYRSDTILRHSLESLSITTSVNPRPLLKALALPGLTRLSVNAREGHFSREETLGLHRLLVNSECALTRLTLADVYPTRTELMRCLRAPACTTLENLVVRATLPLSTITTYARRYVTSDTLKDLTKAVGDEGALLCPKLASMELSHCNCFAEHIVEMVKARVGRGPFSIKYAFAYRGPLSNAVAKELTALSTSHPLKFRESQVQVISCDGR